MGTVHPLDGMNTGIFPGRRVQYALAAPQKTTDWAAKLRQSPKMPPKQEPSRCDLMQPTAFGNTNRGSRRKFDVQRIKNHARITGKQGLYRKNSAEG